MNAELRVGVITKTHGIRGEVKVYPTTDSPQRFSELTEATLRLPGGREQAAELEQARYFKNLVILKLKGIDTVEAAEALKGAEIYIPREQGVPLEEGEYYIADIIDMDVFTEDGQQLGVVRDVLETGANDVYMVRREGMKDLLLPAIPECILDIDLVANRMTVHLMDGLLDL